MSVIVERAAAKRGTRLNLRQVADANGNSLACNDDRVVDLLDRLRFALAGPDEALAADDKFHAAALDRLRAHVDVGRLDGVDHLAERNVVVTQPVGIDFDLVLPYVAANRRDLSDTFHRLQRILDEVVLLGPQFRQVHAFGRVQHVVVDLAQGRGVRTERRRDAFGQRTSDRHQLLDHTRTGPVKIDVVVECHLHKTEAEHALAADVFRTWHGLQRDRKRIRDLVLDILRRTPHPLRKDNDLVLANVGNRVERHFPGGIPTVCNDHDRREQDEEPFADAEIEDLPDHRAISMGSSANGRVC